MDEGGALALKQKIAFSLGHFYNDMLNSMWFTCLLVYLTRVSGLSSVEAGYFLLVGQVVDALGGLLIVYESDLSPGFWGYPKWKSWHLLGTILVTGAFPFFYLPVIGGSRASGMAKMIYYVPFIIIYYIGWPSAQISHLALITKLTSNESERVALNSYRNAMTSVAYAAVGVMIWLLFNESSSNQWNSDDYVKFMILTFTVFILGVVSSILFHIFLKENPQKKESTQSEDLPEEIMTWKDWLKEGQFYIVGVGYMAARLVTYISQAYYPLYITDFLQLGKKYAAIIPLVVYISGFLTSLVMEKVNYIVGRKPTFLLGCIITAGSLVWIALINQSTAYQIFGPAVIFGIGSSVLFINSVSMITDVIGSHTNSSGFVFGVILFVDKILVGVTLMIIQALQPQCEGNCLEVKTFFKDVMTYGIASFDVVCLLVFFATIPYTLGKLKKFSQRNIA